MQVCRAWHAVAASEALWRGKVAELEPHPHLRRWMTERVEPLPCWRKTWVGEGFVAQPAPAH